jgi:response regulator RpfG family c-di-GMP phosphodiesterase
LRHGDNTALVRAAQELSIDKLIKSEREYQKHLDELDTLNNSLKWYQATDQVTEEVKEKYLPEIKQKIAEKEATLAIIVKVATISEMVKYNEHDLLMDIEMLVMDITDYFTTSESMPVARVQELGLLIAHEYKDLTLEDITLCFRQAKTGQMGKVYNRVDGGVIIDWLNQYRSQKREKLAAFNQAKHISFGIDRDKGRSSTGDEQQFKEVYKDFIKGKLEKSHKK